MGEAYTEPKPGLVGGDAGDLAGDQERVVRDRVGVRGGLGLAVVGGDFVKGWVGLQRDDGEVGDLDAAVVRAGGVEVDEHVGGFVYGGGSGGGGGGMDHVQGA